MFSTGPNNTINKPLNLLRFQGDRRGESDALTLFNVPCVRRGTSDANNNPLNYGIKIYDHLDKKDTQLLLIKENKRKSGIYGIYNSINKNLYIGHAITNRFNYDFHRHLFLKTGNTSLGLELNEFGLKNFKFIIFEYFPGIILKENYNKEHLKLLFVKDKWVALFHPENGAHGFVQDIGSPTSEVK